MHRADVLIIGAGQAGLAIARQLQLAGHSVLVLENHRRVGDGWRRHYSSLTLFTSRQFAALPGLKATGARDGYAGKDEFADYLERYTATFAIPVLTETRVTRLMRASSGFVAETTAGSFTAKMVVVATGPGRPRAVPAGAMHIMHSAEYVAPQHIPAGRVLIVGNGNSAAQIALELSATHPTTIAMRDMPNIIPKRIAGRDYFWWTSKLGVQYMRADTFPGVHFARAKDCVVGFALKHALTAGRIERKAGLCSIADTTALFDDGDSADFRTAIFATGFQPDYAWIDVPNALNAQGAPSGKHGISNADGLYFVGLRNQLTPISSNIAGAGRVATFIAHHIRRCMQPSASVRFAPPIGAHVFQHP